MPAKPHIRFTYHPCAVGGYWKAWFVVPKPGRSFTKSHFGMTPDMALRNLVRWHWGIEISSSG